MTNKIDDLAQRIENRFGVVGVFICIVAFLVIFVAWISATILFIWPLSLLAIAAAYMVWSVWRDQKCQ